MLKHGKNLEKLFLIFIAFAILFVCISTVSGADVTVNSTKGENIADGLKTARDGESIELIGNFSGTNNVNIEINKNINFTSNPSNRAIIDGGNNNRLFSNYNNQSIIFENIIFRNAYGEYGSVFDNYLGSLTFINCTFENNFAECSGGAIYVADSHLTLTNCTFNSNFAGNDGGAVYIGFNTFNITSCNFTNNKAENGGAIATSYGGGNGDIKDCNFDDNSATYLGGAIYVHINITYNIEGCNFTRNQAKFGGAIFGKNHEIYLTNSIFDSNTAQYGGGGIYTVSGMLHLANVNFGGNGVVRDGTYFFGEGSLSTANLTGLIYLNLYYSLENYNYFLNNENSSFYDPVFWQNLENLVLNAQNMLNYQNATNQTAIDNLLNNLSSAYDAVNPIASDYSGLNNIINSIPTLNPNDYTTTTWITFQNALDKAIEMNNWQFASFQSQITALIKGLNNSKNGLVKVPTPSTPLNYNVLFSEINAALILNGSKYTSFSWVNLQSVLIFTLNSAKTVSTQSQIDVLVNNLRNAKANLIISIVPVTKPDIDLKITTVKRFGNTYKVTIKNLGKDKSSTTKLKIWYKKGKKTFSKIVNVKGVTGGQSLIVNVVFFKYSSHKKIKKTIHLNYNKAAYEKNYNNNIYIIK